MTHPIARARPSGFTSFNAAHLLARCPLILRWRIAHDGRLSCGRLVVPDNVARS